MAAAEKYLSWIITGLFILMIALVAVQVVNRYVTQLVIPWTEELTRISYVVLIYVGCVLATIQNKHVRIEVIEQNFPSWLRKSLHILFCLVSALFFAVLAYGGYVYMWVGIDASFPTMKALKIGHIMIVIMLCGAAMCILSLFAIRRGPMNRMALPDELVEDDD